jgi:hypothetical protein
METNPPEVSVPEPAARPGISWLILVGFLVGPAVLALVGALAKVNALAIGSPLLGGGIGGVASGILLGGRVGKTVAGKVVAGVLLAVLFACLTLGLGFCGCMLGGFKMDLK